MLLRMDTYHRCRDFDAIHEFTKEKWAGDYGENRVVEQGKVVDYEKLGQVDVLEGVNEEELRRGRWDLPDAIREGSVWDGS